MSVFIGYPSFMAYQMMKGKQGNKDGFPSIPGMIARYSASGLTNEQMAANPVWVDKTGNGHDIQLKNFSWKGMSGVGGYGDENHQTFYKFTLDDYHFIATPPGVKHMNFTFRVMGLQPGNKLTLAFFGTTNTVYGTWDKDGTYTVDADIVEAGKPTYFYNGYGATRGEFTIEILPLYPGALVFDGVDDYGVCENFPILTKEKGYTVVALRQFLSLKDAFLLSKSKTGLANTDGAFLFERNNTNPSGYNFGRGLNLPIVTNPFSYQTSKLYNGTSVTVGDAVDSNILLVCSSYVNSNKHCNAAIWEIVILDHDATEEELQKIQDYYKQEYPWLFPDQAWTVTGKTNEDEDRATIANITGNDNNLVLSNLGFIEGSGYNEEGEYAGYLVTDGVDDKIQSSNFPMGKDFTVVGEWKLLSVSNYNYAGIVKSNNLYVYNSSTGINIYVCSSSAGNKMEGLKSLKAICSDGRVYDDNWVEYKLKNVGDNIGSNSTLDIGTNKNNLTKIAFKNLEIYNNKILSKEDCIKAYNYLQTLKAKI